MTNAKLNENKDGMKNETGTRGKSGIKITGIDAICQALGGKSISTGMAFITRYNLPAKNNGVNVWEMSVADFEEWAEKHHWNPKMPESELRIQVTRLHLEQAGPGQILTGDITQISKLLFTDTSRLMSYAKYEDSPLKKMGGNQWQVDRNQWELFRIRHRVGPYALTGRGAERRLTWE
jgi:hypothetical protein